MLSALSVRMSGRAGIFAILFVNGVAGGFVWPYFPVILAGGGLSPGAIGLVLGGASALALLFRLPLARGLDRGPGRFPAPFLLLFPLFLFPVSGPRPGALLACLVVLLTLFRLPFLPLALALATSSARRERREFSPTSFVGGGSIFFWERWVFWPERPCSRGG